MMSFVKRLNLWSWLATALFVLLGNVAYAQTLPSGWLGRVENNTANVWATYSFTFTPSVSGSQYVMFAFRQDPAYWYFDNARLTVQGQTTNLLTNANFATGGSLSVNTANYGTLNINAPTAWGVGYQSGIYPAAAGTWYGGQWVDGAVGSFDSIYQAVTLTAGTTYVITFDAMSNNVVDNNAVQLGVYAGQCSSLSLAPANCALPSTSGFETVAQPAATYTTGCTTDCPPPPTAPTVTGTTITYTTRTSTTGNTTYVYRTPVTTTTYSDNTSTSTNGTETLYQTKVLSNVVTNKIENGVLTTYTKPVYKVTPAAGGPTTLESAGPQTTSTQNVLTGLQFEVWRYDYHNYSCGWLGCVQIPFSYRTPSTNRSDYGTPVNSGVTTGGQYLQTNARLPNNDGGWINYNDGTVIRYRGTITVPTTDTRPAGTVYRLYFYNNTDDGFKMIVNGTTVIDQNSTNTWQAVIGYTSSGWIDLVAGQTYSLESWYWNVVGGVGHRLYWDYGNGIQQIPNSAFSTGTLGIIDVDVTGLSYSDSNIVNVSGSSIQGLNLCCGGSSAAFSANTQFVTRMENFQARPSQDTHVSITQIGNNNSATVIQSGTANNYSEIYVDGSYNVTNTTQTSTSASATNYIELTVVGSSNTVNLTQSSTGGGKGIMASIGDSSNSLTINQSDDGNHYAEISLTGGNKTVNLTQSGSGAHMAKIELSGGATSLTATQSGSIQQFYSITHNCANVSCAAITVTQGQ